MSCRFCSSAKVIAGALIVIVVSGIGCLKESPTVVPSDKPSQPTITLNEGTSQENDDTVGELLKTMSEGKGDSRLQAAIELLNHKDEIDRIAGPIAELYEERDEVVHDTTNRIFQRLGVEGIRSLNPDFANSDLSHIRGVCSAIFAIGDEAIEYKAPLVELLKTETDLKLRVSAMHALTGFSDGCEEAIPHIIVDLEHSDMNVTLFACRLIIKTGFKASESIPALKALMDRGVISQRGFAGWALAAIGPVDDFDPLPILESQLDRFNIIERERALIGLGLLGDKAASQADTIRNLMNEEGSNLQGPAAIALWKVTGEPEESAKLLVKISQTIDYELSGMQRLAEMGPDASSAKDFLVERLGHADSSIRIAALDALKATRISPSEFQDNLIALKQDPDPVVRLLVAEQLASIE